MPLRYEILFFILRLKKINSEKYLKLYIEGSLKGDFSTIEKKIVWGICIVVSVKVKQSDFRMEKKVSGIYFVSAGTELLWEKRAEAAPVIRRLVV